jgi:hypothetical protein
MVLSSPYVASRIAVRDASLRLRPCKAVVDGTAVTERYFEVMVRGLYLHKEAFAVNTRGIASSGRIV